MSATLHDRQPASSGDDLGGFGSQVDNCTVMATAGLPTIYRGNTVGKTVGPKGSPYSITERRVPELIPVLGSQPAGDVSHKPGSRLPLLSAFLFSTF